jgi:hypothetical protein
MRSLVSLNWKNLEMLHPANFLFPPKSHVLLRPARAFMWWFFFASNAKLQQEDGSVVADKIASSLIF